MPPQVDEFLPQQQQQNQHPQSDVERRINELSSTVDALRRQVSNLQTEMQKITQLAEQSQQNQRVIELSSTVEELRRQLSDMQNEMQRQSTRHEKESSLWKEMWTHQAQQQRKMQSSGRVPDWLRQKILQERRSEITQRELKKSNSTSSPTISEGNAGNQQKSSNIAKWFLLHSSKHQQKPSPSSTSVQSNDDERLKKNFSSKAFDSWAHWINPVAINTSENLQAEKSKIDQASNCPYKKNLYRQSTMTGLVEDEHAIRQAPESPQKGKSSSMTEDEQRQFDLNFEKAMVASAFFGGMKIWNDSLKVARERNCTEENRNEE